MEEEAKAVKEVAKTTGKAIDIGNSFGNFINKVFGDGIVDMGGAFSDWARLYRFERLLELQDRLDKIIDKRKLEGKTIPIKPKIGISIIQNASLEDDDALQDMWANLIANSIDPNTRLNPSKLFISILSELEPLDVALLNAIKEFEEKNTPINRFLSGGAGNLKYIQESLGVYDESLGISLYNIHRLDLITDERYNSMEHVGFGTHGISVDDEKSVFVLTSLGNALLGACD